MGQICNESLRASGREATGGIEPDCQFERPRKRVMRVLTLVSFAMRLFCVREVKSSQHDINT
jgi:hypothetical protein